jgi:CubicO group peptidase (beta-lactamase class C family)
MFLLTLCVPANAQIGNEPVKGLDAYVQKALKEWDAPGLALAIVKDHKVIYARGYGVREMGKPDPVNERTMFAVASTTKAMTAACLGMLVDEGKLKWDDKATQYLPGFQLYDPYVTRELTVRDLITHRSGLSRGDLIWYASPYDRKEVIRRVRFLEPSWSFRSRYGYQNILYIAAGGVIETVSGKTWDDFIKERLFTPLGMTSSNTSITALAGRENVATPHTYLDGRLVTIPWRNVDNVGPAGSVNSNAYEMAQWVRLNLNKGVFEGKRIVSEKVLEEMQSPQTIIPLDSLTKALTPSTHFLTYGLGWILMDYHGRKVVRHDGALDGMRTRVAMMPEENTGVVLITNQTRTSILTALMYRIFDSFLGVKERDWSAEFLKSVKDQEQRAKENEQKRIAERSPNTTPSLALDQYAGTYENEMYGTITVSVENGKLVAALNPSYTGDLSHWHYDAFQISWRDKSLGKSFFNFSLKFNGKVGKVTWEDVGDFIRK